MCAWDLYEHSLLQVICVKFPFIQRHLDHGSRPLIRGFRSFLPSLIVTSNEFLAEYELGTLDSTNTGSVVTTHPTSITAAVYSPLFRQVQYVCTYVCMRICTCLTMHVSPAMCSAMLEQHTALPNAHIYSVYTAICLCLLVLDYYVVQRHTLYNVVVLSWH